MLLNDLKTWTEIAQSLVTIAGILMAGVWSTYIFFLGRSFAPNVKMQVELKQAVKLGHGHGLIISVTAKNIGRTRVKKEACRITVAPLAAPIEGEGQALQRLDPPLPELMKQFPRQYELFHEHDCLEPDEEAVVDVLLAWENTAPLKVSAMFFGARPFRGRQEQWAASMILSPSMFEKDSKSRSNQ